VRRLRRRFTAEGVASLVHGNAGRAPINRTDPAIVERLRALCGPGGTYHDFNVSHLPEVLARDEGIGLPRATLRRLLLGEAIRPARAPRREAKRLRRERRSQEGALLQIDGSPHDWLEGRGPRLALVAAIDGATGKIVYASFRPTEDQAGYLLMLRALAQEYGLPEALYHDRHTILRSPKEPTIEEELSGKRPMSQVQAVLEELGIRSIPALSPQAKGRVERLWRTLQDRLTKEMRLASVSTLEGANLFLPSFTSGFDARFSVEARDPAPAWRPLPAGFDLDYHFSGRAERLVKRDHTLQWLGRCLQIVPARSDASLAGKRVSVHVTPEGALLLYAGQRRLAYREFKPEQPRRRAASARRSAQAPEVDPEVKAAAQARRRGWLFSTGPRG
ncbi:MAG: ISNCY family transposase, partial [Acidobacteriota bacterium]|nr:ISNCY family transposase [Acidobacteriota bacterium]